MGQTCWLTAAGHEQPLGRIKTRADEGPVYSSLQTYRMRMLTALDRPKLPFVVCRMAVIQVAAGMMLL